MGIQHSTNLEKFSDFIASDPAAMEKLSADASGVLAAYGVELDASATEALKSHLSDRTGLDASAQAAVIHIDF